MPRPRSEMSGVATIGRFSAAVACVGLWLQPEMSEATLDQPTVEQPVT